MASRGQKGASNQSGPEAVGAREERWGQREAEIEDLKLAETSGNGGYVVPSARNLSKNHEEAQNRTRDVEEHLHHVGPDDSCHPTFKRVEQRQADDKNNGPDLARSEDDGDHDRDRENPYAFG